jgi:hypothetical protein
MELNSNNNTRITLGRKLRSLPSLHAELAVLYKANVLNDYLLYCAILNIPTKKSKLPSKKLFVIRIKNDGDNHMCLSDSTPCSLCRKVLIYLGIKKIIYINRSSKITIDSPTNIISGTSKGILYEKIFCKKFDIIHSI